MATLIHMIEKNGAKFYRIWSTVSESYITAPIKNLESLKSYLIQEAVQDAIERVERDFPERLERAHKKGTSCRLNNRQRLDDWDDENKQ